MSVERIIPVVKLLIYVQKFKKNKRILSLSESDLGQRLREN